VLEDPVAEELLLDPTLCAGGAHEATFDRSVGWSGHFGKDETLVPFKDGNPSKIGMNPCDGEAGSARPSDGRVFRRELALRNDGILPREEYAICSLSSSRDPRDCGNLRKLTGLSRLGEACGESEHLRPASEMLTGERVRRCDGPAPAIGRKGAEG
jgi:hypothetical protein